MRGESAIKIYAYMYKTNSVIPSSFVNFIKILRLFNN
jgi:hypothetical protein